MSNIETFIIDNPKAFGDLKEYVSANDFHTMAFDLETDSVVEKKAHIYGIGVCFQDDEAFYIPIRNKDGTKVFTDEVESDIFFWLKNAASCHNLIGHNIIYDVLVFENNTGIDLTPLIYSDTILMKHTVDEERPFGLKEVAVQYLGAWADKAQQDLYENIQANGGSTTKDNLQMFKADTEVLGIYCGWDVALTYKLFFLFEKKISDEGLTDLFYRDEVMPLYKECTIPMKRHGFPIDVSFFENLKLELTQEIELLEEDIQKAIREDIAPKVAEILETDYPEKTTGTFPKIVANILGIELPKKLERVDGCDCGGIDDDGQPICETHDTGKITLSKASIKNQASNCGYTEGDGGFWGWLLGHNSLDADTSYNAQLEWMRQDTGRKYVFNLNSKDHLAWLFFNTYGELPLDHTETGKPQVNAELLDTLKKSYPWVEKLIDFNQLNKLLSTYVEGILEQQIDSVIYTSLLQFGTTSGRYASRSPNLQNIPRVKDEDSEISPLVLKYVNSIKRGFVAPPGYKIVNADFSQLEPCCFAHCSGDEKLREVFRKGEDLYCAIAIEAKKLYQYSADKKSPKYLKNFFPELRQRYKAVALARVYGAEAYRISQLLDISYQEAQEIIDSYDGAYDELVNYMRRCEMNVKLKGYAETEFGRKRHLSKAVGIYSRYKDRLLDKRWAKAQGLGELRWQYKNMLNLGKNQPIQGLAAHIVNRAMIAASRAFVANNIDGYIALTVHDEITCIVRADQAELAKKLLRTAMETTTVISVPLKAEPLIADNLAEAK